MSMEKIRDWLRENRITEVECLVPDMTGKARGKFIPADKFIKEDSRLPESILVQTVTGDYTNIHDELVNPMDTDMSLHPDPNTMRLVPWAEDPTGQIIHDCYTRAGEPHPLASRNVLKRVLALYEAEGWKPVVAPEVEFYLVQKNIDPDYELEPPVGRSGRREAGRQSYSIDAANEFDPIVEDIYAYCEAQELDIDTLAHEGGAAQLEINFNHGDALELADQVFLFKRTVREAAIEHEMRATFLAKPMSGEAGSALHIHQSVVDKDGVNIFSTPAGEPSDLFYGFLGGLQRYMPEALLIFAPYVNSFRRFLNPFDSPVNLAWAIDNRTVGLRVPDAPPEARRIENRLAGSDVNPYLVIAGTLACGYLGMVEGLRATDPIEGSAYGSEFGLHRHIYSAIEALRESIAMRSMLGDDFVRLYCALKDEEYMEFQEIITPWEREILMFNV